MVLNPHLYVAAVEESLGGVSATCDSPLCWGLASLSFPVREIQGRLLR